ncbi:MAG: acetyl-CoA carboxylase subunit beta [Elusimicrobia bacterium CG1_02_37_114]|nr:MAG: acetyl-CoA carboxylase subunit beta [Elusimicrobia bacterium CG1_02_37_114]PIV53229.1 MAG: acetyl-CoA carboxylase carboxyl transferase subunit beta [Elusimicrobia bacterium CG02_land_8_20_14_3_00_37_13]
MAKSNKSNGDVHEGLWSKCKKCEQIIYNKELDENLKVCPKCGSYFKMSAYERINMLAEPKSFKECNKEILPVDVLAFPEYSKKLTDSQKKFKMADAVVTGECLIGKNNVLIAVLDFDFMGGSMGSVVGEKVTNAIEKAIKRGIPLIIISASGGARMQEGIFSLMQMAKTSQAIAKLHMAKIPFISVLTDPTSGGVAASFAMLGDINIAEPKALIAFAGPRVIEQTIRQKLPEGFQLSEFLVQHGMIDLIAERKELKNTLVKLLTFFKN